MEYYFIHMAAAASVTIPFSIEPILLLLFECMRSYLGNGITNVDLQMLNCLWFIGITLFFNGAPQKIVQRCQIATSRWLILITISGNSTSIKPLMQ